MERSRLSIGSHRFPRIYWTTEAAWRHSLDSRLSKEPDMTDQLLILGTQLLLAMVWIMLAELTQSLCPGPQLLKSVGWHGGKTKR